MTTIRPPLRLASALFAVLFASAALTPCATAQTADELETIRLVFDELQPKSFKRNAEYCGYIGYRDDGELMVSVITPGETDGCSPVWPNDFEPVASFHTHGGYDPGAWSELPSVDDIEADAYEGVDGWVATPGGRLWFLDTEEMTVRLMCGVGCLDQDPRFQRETLTQIDDFYTYEELIEFEADNP